MAAQEQDLNAKTVAHEIYHTVHDPSCGLHKQHAEAAAHIINSCSKLTRTDYTERHNNVASIQGMTFSNCPYPVKTGG